MLACRRAAVGADGAIQALALFLNLTTELAWSWLLGALLSAAGDMERAGFGNNRGAVNVEMDAANYRRLLVARNLHALHFAVNHLKLQSGEPLIGLTARSQNLGNLKFSRLPNFAPAGIARLGPFLDVEYLPQFPAQV